MSCSRTVDARGRCVRVVGRGLVRRLGGNPLAVTETPTPETDPTPLPGQGTDGEPTQDAPAPSHEHGHDTPDHYPTEDDPA